MMVISPHTVKSMSSQPAGQQSVDETGRNEKYDREEHELETGPHSVTGTNPTLENDVRNLKRKVATLCTNMANLQDENEELKRLLGAAQDGGRRSFVVE